MQRSIIITIGVSLLLVVSSVWLYLLLFGPPTDPEEVFSDLGLPQVGNTPRPTSETLEVTTSNPVVDVFGDSALRQLQTKAIAGFGFSNSATTSVLWHAERGTGHVFALDLETGQETRLSGVTVANTVDAQFAPTGDWVALTTSDGFNTKTVLQSLIPEPLPAVELPPNSVVVQWQDNMLIYTIRVDMTTVGYRYDTETETTSTVFTSPLPEQTTVWENNQTYLYPKPTPHFRGGYYRITDNALERVGSLGFSTTGFTLPGRNQHIITQAVNDNEPLNSTLISDTNSSLLPLAVIPEWCAGSQATTTVWCATNQDVTSTELHRWHQGEQTLRGSLWRIDTSVQTARLVADWTEASGQAIDPTNLAWSRPLNSLFFINRIDDTVWMYDLGN